MMLIEETAVSLTALPFQEFKAHLRLGTGFSDGDVQDQVLEGFLRAAAAAIEARTGKVLFERTFFWTLTEWRHRGRTAITCGTGIIRRHSNIAQPVRRG